ncbi:MAG TPA: hypothetical protein VKJ07_03430, partial [Mycobacteriales bacterium]|nr:hypothetical protein [Mycobacteriales bacterium]
PNTGAQVPVGIKLANPTALTADDLTALQNAAVTRFRYDFTDPSTTLPAGDITIAFAGTWLDSMGDAPGAGSATVHVAGPTGVLVTAAGGSGIDINSLNGRTYLDVTVPAAPTGFATDWGAMGQRTVLFTLSGPGVGTAKLDTSQAPLVDTGAGTIRYWITGSFGTGAVVLNWVTGAPALKATVIANVTSSGLVNQGAATIDVLFPSVPTGDKVVSSSLDFTEFTLGGTGIGTGATQLQINSGVRPQVLADGKTVRYYVAGVPTDESQVSATFVGGTHTFDVVPVIGGSSQTITSTTTELVNVNDAFGLDVTFPVPVGATLDAASLQTFKQVTLDGSGIGALAIDASTPAVLLSGGVVEYRVGGTLGTSGEVDAHFVPGTWSYTTNISGTTTTATIPAQPTTYIDIQYRPTVGGATVVPTGVPFTLHNSDSTPMTVLGSKDFTNGLFRYYVSGQFKTGTASVVFTKDKLSDGKYTNGQCAVALVCTVSFAVLGPTARLVGPTSKLVDPDGTTTIVGPNDGSIVGANQVNALGYIDVPFVAPAGLTLDATSVTSDAITLGGPGAAGFALDPNQKIPVLVSQSGNTWVYRFWTVGSYTGGDVQVSFVAGRVRFN